jgi:diaminohydroxyphosphoribosylaminopyrimidine deaminase/5-amino-6-(5-phosphoribosylamino)uracil reductase
VLVGAGTALADDPRLTVRHVPGRQPLRVVLDRAGTLPPTLRLFADAHAGRTVAVIGETAAPAYAVPLEAAGGRLLRLPETEGHLDLGLLLDRLGAGTGLPDGTRPVQSLLVEAGPGLATALLRADLVDRLFVFVAPKLTGQGKPGVYGLGIQKMNDALGFAEVAWEPVGADVLFKGYVRSLD